MGTAIFLRNIVGKAAYIFLIRIIPLQRNFNSNAIFCLHGKMENIIQMVFAFVNIFHELRQTTFIVIDMFQVNTLIFQDNTYTGIQERQLT